MKITVDEVEHETFALLKPYFKKNHKEQSVITIGGMPKKNYIKGYCQAFGSLPGRGDRLFLEDKTYYINNCDEIFLTDPNIPICYRLYLSLEVE